MTEEELYALLDARGVAYEVAHHAPVATVAEADAVVPRLGTPTKNLFLRDSKKRRHFLVVAHEDTPIDLRHLHERLGSTRLSFASAETLRDKLGLVPGSVTPFGALNDPAHEVEVVFGNELRGRRIDAHPLVNTATMFLYLSDVVATLEAFGTPVRFADLTAGV